MELMKEDGKEVGTPSNLVDKRKKRRKRTRFSDTKLGQLRVQKRREASASDAIDRQPLWRLGKICATHLESIPEEEEARSSASEGEMVLTAMAEEESKQPSSTAQSDLETWEKEYKW